MYAKRDIYLHEELFTGYGKPQWIYTLFFFPNHLSPQTLQALRHQYQLPTNITADMVRLIQPEDLPLLHPADPTDHPDTPDCPTTNVSIMEDFVEVPATPDHLTPNASTAPPSTVIPNCTPPHPPQPHGLAFPHGTQEGVGTRPSTMPNAGQGLYGIRPLQDAPHPFARKGQIICIYATQA